MWTQHLILCFTEWGWHHPVKRNNHLMLFQCWASVCHAGPTLQQHGSTFVFCLEATSWNKRPYDILYMNKCIQVNTQHLAVSRCIRFQSTVKTTTSASVTMTHKPPVGYMKLLTAVRRLVFLNRLFVLHGEKVLRNVPLDLDVCY